MIQLLKDQAIYDFNRVRLRASEGKPFVKLSLRKKQHEFDLRREKEDREKKEKNLQANKNKMKVEGEGMKKKKKKKKKKKGDGGFQVGKRNVKTKLTALTKAKVEQAMELNS